MAFNPFKRSRPPSEDVFAVEVLHDPAPVTLLTGFLGAGKTTLLNDLLSSPEMAGAAVIVNEFGLVPVDHSLVRAGSERYFRTTTGCLCCTATSDIRSSLFDLHDAVRRGEVPRVNRVVVETTGLADPAPIINSLVPGGAPEIGQRDRAVCLHYYLSDVITAFDVLNGRVALDDHMEGWKQLAFADRVVLTKTDVSGESVDWEAELRPLNPSAEFHDRHMPEFTLGALLGTRAYDPRVKAGDVAGWLAMERVAKHADHLHDPNRHGDGIQAICLEHDAPLDPGRLSTFLELVTRNQVRPSAPERDRRALRRSRATCCRPCCHAHALSPPSARGLARRRQNHAFRADRQGNAGGADTRTLQVPRAANQEEEAERMSGGFANPLQRHGPGIVSQARSVKQWTREALALDEKAIVSVNEVACALPGCPPKETIILVMIAERGARQVSIHKPLIEVDFNDVEAAWRDS